MSIHGVFARLWHYPIRSLFARKAQRALFGALRLFLLANRPCNPIQAKAHAFPKNRASVCDRHPAFRASFDDALSLSLHEKAAHRFERLCHYRKDNLAQRPAPILCEPLAKELFAKAACLLLPALDRSATHACEQWPFVGQFDSLSPILFLWDALLRDPLRRLSQQPRPHKQGQVRQLSRQRCRKRFLRRQRRRRPSLSRKTFFLLFENFLLFLFFNFCF